MKNNSCIKKIKSFVILLLCMLCLTAVPACSDYSDNTYGDFSNYISETENTDLIVADKDNSESVNNQNQQSKTYSSEGSDNSSNVQAVSLNAIPNYSGKPYTTINNNTPNFSELSATSFEKYSSLDFLGRCGVAYASLCKDTMPTEERGSIGQVKPSGWQTAKYDFVDGKYLYNRCHLIGFQLSAENANVKNLITGTRYMNVDGMLPFENMVADYIKETGNHVMYRVTPIYYENNLVVSGVQMEAKSVEDNGDGILFNVFCYNVQPGVTIDYATGDNYADGSYQSSSNVSASSSKVTDDNSSKVNSVSSNSESLDVSSSYILNTNTKKFHRPDCSSAKSIKESNRESFNGTRSAAISNGYVPCKKCNP